MRLNDILALREIDPKDVAIILHTPRDPRLRRLLPWIAAERVDLFEAYQSVHSPSVEATLKGRKYALSFVDIGDSTLALAGLYEINGWEDRAISSLYEDTLFNELSKLEGIHAGDISREQGIETRCVFNFLEKDSLAQYGSKLVISKPKGRTYVRLAENLDAEVLALHQESQLSSAPPEWRDFIVRGSETRGLPKSWAARLREWQGVYLIVDESDGARYVGSAYGVDNLLGRWRAHVAGERGITKHLSGRDPINFRFSILERVGPDLIADEVVGIENSWKARLHTIEHGLNVS